VSTSVPPGHSKPPLLSERTLLLLVVSAMVAGLVGWLTYEESSSAPTAGLAALAAFAAAVKGLHEIVE
jgi:hypothetical protein